MSAAERYTTERLNKDLESGFPGNRNAAPYLLQLDTPEQRLRAVSEAHTLTNLLGFRYSEAVQHASSALLKNISEGKEDEPLYGEKTARHYREVEAEYRKATRGY